jgi:hypothetical protein
MMMNMVGNRVITKEICEQHHAFDPVVWRDDQQTRVGMLDPSYGGGDRCVWGWLEFGYDIKDRQIIRFGDYKIVPFAPNSSMTPEDQVAQFVKSESESNFIEAENIFYDSSGKGTIGAAFARVFGFKVPAAIFFGGNPTIRPVRHDLWVQEKDGSKRLKRCDEEYRKFVTELWFAARNVIECDQMRELPEEVAKEGWMREYTDAPGGKTEVETKDETRERLGMSPDLFDCFVTGIEGCRQLGFQIGRLGEDVVENETNDDWFETEAKAWQETIKSKLLVHR